jgi:hypothetical protein
MGTCRALLVCFSLLTSAYAQQPQKDRVKLEGVVVNSLTGKPLPRVLVQLSSHALLTGPEGEFSFDGLSPGRIYVSLTKPGYFGPGSLARGRTADAMVDVGPESGKVVLKMTPEAVIFGRVTGQDEEPLEGAAVQVLARTSVDGRQTLTQTRGGVQTDEDGNFRIASLAPGRYYLVVKAGGVARRILGAQTPKSSEAYPAAVYYPGTTDLVAANPIDLAPGQKMEAHFSLTLTPAFRLAGKVVASGEWKQVHSPLVIDSMEQPLFGALRFDAATGSFEFPAIPAGIYTVRLSGSDVQDRYRSYDQKITVSKSRNDVALLLQPGVDISVVTRTEFNKPRPSGNCVWNRPGGQEQRSDCSDYPAAGLELVSIDSLRTQVSSEYRPMEDPSRFALHGVAPGKYMIRARSTMGGYVQSLRSGNVDLLREVLTVPESGSVAPIEVVLRDDSGGLKVRVHAEKPGQTASIVVLIDGAIFPIQQPLTGNTNSDVYFGFLPPGNYKVLAFDTLDGVDYGNPEVLAQYASKMGSVTVAPNGNASVAVDLIHVGD